MTSDIPDRTKMGQQNQRMTPPSRDEVPGRKTRPAYTSRRRGWYGWGKTGSSEKNTFGRFLHDIPFIFVEIAIFSLPVLMWIASTVQDTGYGVSGSALVGWTTMTVVATAIHMGLIRPFATDTLGWVSITPSLVGLRIVYYNVVLLLVSYGSVTLATVSGYPRISLAISISVAALAMLLFPSLGETVARSRSQ